MSTRDAPPREERPAASEAVEVEPGGRPRRPPDFRALFEASPGLLLALDATRHFTIVAVTDALLRATGIERAALLGRPLVDVFPGSTADPETGDARRLRASLERAVSRRRPDALERYAIAVRKPASEGGGVEERAFRMLSSPVVAADGAVSYLVHSLEQATEPVAPPEGAPPRPGSTIERLTLEAADAIAKFRAFFEQSLFYAGIMTPDGTLVDINRSALEACGYTREEVLGKPFWETGWWHGSKEVQERVRAGSVRAARGEKYAEELPYFFADGTERITDFALTPVWDDRGAVIYLVPTGMDITDRKRNEAALRRSEARRDAELATMRALHRASMDVAVATSIDAALDVILKALVATLGADKGSVQILDPASQTLRIAAHTGFDASFLALFRSVSARDETACGRALRTGCAVAIPDVRADPACAPLLAVAAAANYRAVYTTPLKSRDDEILGMLSTFFPEPHDFSETEARTVDLFSRLATDVLERIRFQNELEEGNRRKTEFIATLAHELRNPLAPVRNALELQRASGGDAEVTARCLSIVERQIAQMVRLVDDLLDISRVSTGKLELRREPVDVAEVVRSAVETSTPAIDAGQHRLTLDLPAEPLFVHADPTRLAQAIQNLLTNAAKYSEDGSAIHLSVESGGDEVAIRVSDRGVGIAPDTLPRVFDLFAQVEGSLGRAQGGLGIGLALVKRVIEMHGGRVEARSEGLGKGSDFALRLSRLDPPRATPSPAPKRGAPRVAGLRVLVVDDNEDAAQTLGMLLQVWGNRVLIAADGYQALREIDGFSPDVVFMDIGMPGLNGYDVAARIRADPRHAAVTLVAVTGWGQQEDRDRSKQVGFDHHCVKPLDIEALKRIIDSAA